MASHTWTSLHGDMPIHDMNEEREPLAMEGEMPTRPMNVAQAHGLEQREAVGQEIDAELRLYRQRQASEARP